MNKTQTSLLLALAKKLKKENNTSKELALKSLSSAGIVTKEGKVTKSFPNLDRVLSIAE